MLPTRRFSLLSALHLAIAGGLLLTGCATSHRLTVDATPPPLPATAEAQSFHLVNANPESDSAAPGFAIMADYVCTALSSKGLFQVPAHIRPEVVIEIDYGVDAIGRDVRTGAWDTRDPYEPKPVVVTFYDKFLRISAHEPTVVSTASRTREVWSVYVTGANEEADLRSYAVLLVSAAMDALGNGRKGVHEIVLNAQDDRVAFVQRGM